LFVVGKSVQSQRLPVKSGKETLLGKQVSALTQINTNEGKVFVEGEYWNARSATPVNQGETVQIIGIEGLTLKVAPKT
jgi:membrane-bound serine protease (ClpP class)